MKHRAAGSAGPVPKGVYEINEPDSPGRFELQDEQMYGWSAQVTGLEAGRSRELTLVLTKHDAALPAWDFEVLAYNESAGLIATAPASR